MSSFLFLFLSLVFLVPVKGHAKFSREVFKQPCSLLEIEILSCKESIFFNGNEKAPINFNGVVVEAKIKSERPTKCRLGHQMEIKKFKKFIENGRSSTLFIQGADCKKPPTKVTKTNQFCDTPGANSVPECFIRQLEARENFVFTLSELFP